MKKTLAIVGSFPETRSLIDWNRTDCDIWVFNEAMTDSKEWVKRADAVFQMHQIEVWKSPVNRNDPHHYDWLKSGNTPPVYMQEKYPDVPNAVKYPLENVLALGKLTDKFCSSSVAYALGLGIQLGYKRIECYGLAMMSDTEYRYQREGVAYWLGQAEGRGIEIEFLGDSFDTPLYGYAGEIEIPLQAIIDRIGQLSPICDEEQTKYERCKAETEKVIAEYIKTGSGAEALDLAARNQIAAAVGYAVVDGARQENERYLEKAKKMIAANDGFILHRQEFEGAMKGLIDPHKNAVLATATAAGQCELYFRQLAQGSNKTRRKRLAGLFSQAFINCVELNVRANMMMGGIQENQQYMTRLDAGIRAAGGSKSEAVILDARKA